MGTTKSSVGVEKCSLPENSLWVRDWLKGIFGSSASNYRLVRDLREDDKNLVDEVDRVGGSWHDWFEWYLSKYDRDLGTYLIISQKVERRIFNDWDNPYIYHAGVTFTQQVNCCGILVITNMMVESKSQRKGIGKGFLRLAQDIAYHNDYSQLLCTYAYPGQSLFEKLLRADDKVRADNELKWNELYSFKNYNTDNTVKIVVRSTGLWETHGSDDDERDYDEDSDE